MRTPITIDQAVAADFAEMGVAVEAVAADSVDDEAFKVWKANEDTLVAFLAVETQWRIVASMAGLIWLGLDYSAVDVALRRRKSPDHVFDDLQIMEMAALEAFNEALA